jgi:hypothetical protein
MIAAKQTDLIPAHWAYERVEYHPALILRRVALATNATVGAAVVGVMNGANSSIAITLRGRHGA